MAWLPSHAICTRPGPGWLKVKTQELLGPVRLFAGAPLMSRSAASGPVTASVNRTVICARLLMVLPAAGVALSTAGGVMSAPETEARGSRRSAASAAQSRFIFMVTAPLYTSGDLCGAQSYRKFTTQR